ncbi:uncharacterized protein LOC129593339 [Paramacrobiotus metropolitanus]|uniref:uncharacterized protein LOC129593339 n=1 Tax=Paramacrobiotus metropolitanus TaxID=2943436 RepID=UPI00244621B8|nr:uncharacterized protein LOC129593339 [Paramacrobiotus metropolitanus]
MALHWLLTFFLAVVLLRISESEAKVSCQFNTNYCGWTRPDGAWEIRDSINGYRTVYNAAENFAGASGIARTPTRDSYGLNGHHLLSEPISLNTTTKLSFWIFLSEMGYISQNHYRYLPNAHMYIQSASGNWEEIWALTNNGRYETSQHVTLTLEPMEYFRLRLKIVAAWHQSGVMAMTLHKEGESDGFLSCTFRSGTCGWINAGDGPMWVTGCNDASSLYRAPDISADNLCLIARNANSTETITAALQSPMLLHAEVSRFAFYFRCGINAELVFVIGAKQESVKIWRRDSWEHAFIEVDALDNVQFKIVATLPYGSYCAIDEVTWSADNGGYTLLPHQTSIATSKTPTTEIPEVTSTFSGSTETTITVRCQRGNLTFSEMNFDMSEAMRTELHCDNTLKCRRILSQAHQWILDHPHQARAETSVDIISVVCDAQNGLSVSSSNPEESEASSLVFITAVNLSCRSIFVDFLKALAALGPSSL